MNYVAENLCGPIGLCSMTITVVHDATTELQNANEINKSGGDLDEILERLKLFIQLHTHTKELSFIIFPEC